MRRPGAEGRRRCFQPTRQRSVVKRVACSMRVPGGRRKGHPAAAKDGEAVEPEALPEPVHQVPCAVSRGPLGLTLARLGDFGAGAGYGESTSHQYGPGRSSRSCGSTRMTMTEVRSAAAGAGEGCGEVVQGGGFLGQAAHRAGVGGEVDGDGVGDRRAVGEERVEGSVAGVLLQLLMTAKPPLSSRRRSACAATGPRNRGQSSSGGTSRRRRRPRFPRPGFVSAWAIFAPQPRRFRSPCRKSRIRHPRCRCEGLPVRGDLGGEAPAA